MYGLNRFNMETRMPKIIKRAGVRAGDTRHSAGGPGRSPPDLSLDPSAGLESDDLLLMSCEAKPAKDVRDNLAVVVNEARYQGKCTIITQHGKLAAAVVPIDDLSTMLRLKQRRNAKPEMFDEITGSVDDLYRAAKGGDRGDEKRTGEKRNGATHLLPRGQTQGRR
jgi:prevent-host-death family protein